MSLLLFGQILGILACGLSLNACLNTNDRNFKKLIVSGCLLWTVHNLILGANVAAVFSLVTAARCALSIDARNKRLIPIFFTLYVGIAIFHAESWIDWLPVAAAVIGTVSFFCLSGAALRAAHCLGCPLWILHDLHYGSIGGIIAQSCTLAFCVYTILRMPAARAGPGAVAIAQAPAKGPWPLRARGAGC